MAVIIKGKNTRRGWTARYQDGGRQRERSFATRREAQDFIAKFEHDSRLNVFVDPRNGSVPFVEYAAQWIGQLDRAPGTVDGYRLALTKHVAPAVGGRSLAAVAQDRELAASILATMRAAGLSASRVGTVRSLLRGVLGEAVAAGRVPAHRLDGLSVRRPAAQAATIIPATHDQLAAIASGLRAGLGLSVWLMLGAGLRVSEALAVRLDGFRDNGHGRILRVHEQVTRAGGLGPLKARREGEYRDVPCPAWLWEKVQEHVTRYGTDADGYLFSRPGGGRVTYGGYQSRFRSRACRAGLPDYSPHDLRHLFASRLLTSGVPISDVSKWLGHRDINVTHQIYSHLLPDSWDRARDVLESLAA